MAFGLNDVIFRYMKKIIGISIIPGEFHPALGPRYLVRFNDQTTSQIYADHFFDDFEFDPITPKDLIGQEVSQEFIDMFGL